MRILFTTPILEHPAAGGPELKMENSIKALSKVSELDIIHRVTDSSVSSEVTNAFFSTYATEYHVLADSSLLKRKRAPSIVNKLLDRVLDTAIRLQADYILDHVDRRRIDAIWFGYGNISFPLIRLIKSRRPQLKVVCDTDSVWSRFVLRELPYASGFRKLRIWLSGRRKEIEERAWVDLCDATTAVSDVDAEYYRNIASDPRRIFVFSNVIDMESYASPPAPPANFKSPSVYLAGSFGHYNSPMDTAARWVLNSIFPKILQHHPNTHFYIVGRNSDAGFGHLNSGNITATGRLESVLPYLCNVDVALVPLKFESGTRFKILEAGACKVPLVSTTLGAEGIPVVDGEHILIADEADDFADAVVKLLDDKVLATRLAANCHALIANSFSVDALIVEAKNILEYLNHD